MTALDVNDTFTDLDTWDSDSSQSKYDIYHNPKGLWLSVGASWQIWTTTKPNLFVWKYNMPYLYKVRVKDSVLVIKSTEEFIDFIKKYKNDDESITMYNIMNWKKIKEKYDGIILETWVIPDIFGSNDKFHIDGDGKTVQTYFEKLLGQSWKNNIVALSEWVRHWETSSGVIWRKSGIKSIKLVKTFKSYIEVHDKL